MSEVIRQGLWKNTSKAGQDYLSGVDKEKGIKYFVFVDDSGIASLSTTVLDSDGGFTSIGKMAKKNHNETEFLALELNGIDYSVWPNKYYEEGTRKPEYNLVMKAKA